MFQPERLELWRSQIGHRLIHDRRACAVEILVAGAGVIGWGLLPIPRTIVPFVVFAWLSLHVRGASWRDVGLRRPQNLPATVLVGVAVAVGAAVGGALVMPALNRLTGEAAATANYQFLRGDFGAWLGLLAAIWPLAALMEEMVFRGYFLNRLADLFGRSRWGWLIGLLGSSFLFALMHGLPSFRVLLTAFSMGMLEGGIYLAWKRNLWMPILLHGAADSITLTMQFLGVT